MSTRLRVFVSSTMKDLGDARQAVVARLRDLNLEPVNAENLHPTGGSSWDVIREEIDGSHLFILLSGDTYGWIPKNGPGADELRSVTHMEVRHAMSIGLPILPFFKQIGADAPRRTKDARARDAFRTEVEDWDGGMFRQEYVWIRDLERKVTDALLNLFHRSVLREAAERRRAAAEAWVRPSGPLVRIPIPAGFAGRDAVLFAGAGVSVSAGLPTAAVMTELFGLRLSLKEDGERILARHRFADVASALERRFGRDELERTVVEAFDVVNGAVPTPGHHAAVRTFRHIVTTNYDDLFERAAREQRIPFRRISANGEVFGDGNCADLTIFQVDGSISSPGTLVVTEEDAMRVRQDDGYWAAIEETIGNRPVVVVGHSLRDESARRVLTRRGSGQGLYVSMMSDVMDAILRERFGLLGCVGRADDFLQSYEEAERRAMPQK